MITRLKSKMATLVEVHTLLIALQKEQKISSEKIDELLKEVKAKDDKIEALEKRVQVLESNLSVANNTIKLLDRKCDDNEQYSRRMSLRVSDIPISVGRETADISKELAVNTINKIPGVEITKSDIDRAHRVGVGSLDRPRQMIIKFKSWDTRSMVYQERKSLRGNKIFLDLTKRRFALKKVAIEKVQDFDDKVDFAFSDINCSLCLKLTEGGFKYFNSEDELDAILASS